MKCQEKKTTGKRVVGTESWIAQGKGTIIGIISMLFTLALCAGLIAGGVIPEKGMNVCVLTAAGVGSMTAEFSAARTRGKGSGLSGMLSGLLMTLICLMSGFLLYGNVSMLRCAAIGFVMIFCGGLSGYICAGKKRRRR